jgi:[acyl-carrier-protein] S-malonyltransferase
MGVTAVIELPPAGTLAGLVKRELPGVTITKLAGPDDLPAARALLGPAVLDLEAPELTSTGARS